MIVHCTLKHQRGTGINALTLCVCLCVTEVGCSTRLVTCDLESRTKNVRERWAQAWAAIFQNSCGCKWVQSGSSSRSGHNRGAAAEADAIGEQQLCTESCLVLDYSHSRTVRGHLRGASLLSSWRRPERILAICQLHNEEHTSLSPPLHTGRTWERG